jgi:hypothetical protein
VSHLQLQSKSAANPSGSVIVAVTVTLLAIGAAQPLIAQTTPDRQAATLTGFSLRVQQYLDLSKKVEGPLAKLSPTNNPAKIDEHKKALAGAIQAARRDAKQGDVFGDAADEFRRIIRSDAERRTLRDAYAAMQEVPRQQPVSVNAEYPKGQALATVPPLILTRLPRIPDGLEYRFMGRDLILYDSASDLIVDFIREAVPSLR